jgi:hypothetical protein
MTVVRHVQPVPVGQQAPPARAAASDTGGPPASRAGASWCLPGRACHCYRTSPKGSSGVNACLTNITDTDISLSTNGALALRRNTGRHRSEQVVVMRRNEWSSSPECADQHS